MEAAGRAIEEQLLSSRPAKMLGRFLDLVPDEVQVVDLGVPRRLSGALSVLGDASAAMRLAPILLTPGAPWILGAAPALTRYLDSRRPDA